MAPTKFKGGQRMRHYCFALLLSFTISVIHVPHTFADAVHITGVVNGIQTEDSDGFVDGALVLPTFRSEALLQFDIENLLAPNEPMKAGPKQINVPGNLY